MTQERYIVDERVGCIAVIDTNKQEPSPGLHADDSHVEWYRGGYSDERNELCPWHVRGIDRVEAWRVCNRLNGGEE